SLESEKTMEYTKLGNTGMEVSRIRKTDERLVVRTHAAVRNRSNRVGKASTMRQPKPIDRSWSGSRKSRKSMGFRVFISRLLGCDRRGRLRRLSSGQRRSRILKMPSAIWPLD